MCRIKCQVDHSTEAVEGPVPAVKILGRLVQKAASGRGSGDWS